MKNQLNKVPVVYSPDRDPLEVEEEGLEGTDSLDKDPLDLDSSRPQVHILPAPMRHVARFIGENAIGQ